MNDPFQSLELIFQKVDADLQFVVHRLEAEFNKKLENTKQNPLKIIQRIKRIQEDLPNLQEDIERIVACKQSLLEDSQRLLFSNGISLEKLQMSVGEQQPLGLGGVGYKKGSEIHPSYQQFNKVIEDWERDTRGYTWGNFLYPTQRSNEKGEEKNDNFLGEQSNWVKDSDSNENNGLLVNREDLNANILRTVAAIPPSSKPPNTQQATTITTQTTSQPAQITPQNNALIESEDFSDDFKPAKKERNKNVFEFVSEEEFMSLGSSVRGKCKLVDVNKVYEKNLELFQR